MSGDVSVDLGSVLRYAEDRLRSLFGTDATTLEWNQRLARRIRAAVEQSRWIQCIGMSQPVPIEHIYQQLKIQNHREVSEVWSLLEEKRDAVLFAGPGRGKSTLLKWLCIQLLDKSDFFPVLFILRSPGSVADLTEFTSRLSMGQKAKPLKGTRPLLLIDGYDEIDVNARKAVSKAIETFRSAECGTFLLTCRTFYDVYDVNAHQYYLTDFTDDDVIAFIKAFCTSYGTRINARRLLTQLEQRGLSEFCLHPLTLTLICILKTGAVRELPNNTLGLLKRVLDLLTLRWDQSRGIARTSQNPLDGEDRVRCLMRIAFYMNDLHERQERIEDIIRDHVKLIQRRRVDARIVLQEMAQWYGILAPVEEGTWQFVHKSIHDYLAGRFWIESGTFAAEQVTSWNARAAYAACLSPDATKAIVASLERGHGLSVLSECLYNNAPFETAPVADAIVSWFQSNGSIRADYISDQYVVQTPQAEIFDLASERLLLHLVIAAINKRTRANDVVLGYALGQVVKRKKNITDRNLRGKVFEYLGTASFQFRLGFGGDYFIFAVGKAFS
ncbi:MAG: hypothetical protein ABSG25_04025 [Bryobacteraceae bacterium]